MKNLCASRGGLCRTVSSVREFLSLLAHSQCCIQVSGDILENNGNGRLCVMGLTGGERSCVGGVSVAMLRDASAYGWVGERTPPNYITREWGLTRDGRGALRRLKSASDDCHVSGLSDHVPTVATRPDGFPASGLIASGPKLDTSESPLAWLRRRKDRHGQRLITAPQFEAGERLRADLWFGQMTPRVTVDWSGGGGGGHPSGQGVDVSDAVITAQQRVRSALDAAGPEFAGLLIDVCGHLKGLEAIELDRGWPPRSGKVVLQIALTALARHYGLMVPPNIATPTRHWGSADYRPSSRV
jgi:hypothetical protein